MRHFAVRSLQPAACNARIAPRRASQNASAPKPRATRRAENASPPSMAQNRLPAYDTVSYIQRKGRGAPTGSRSKGPMHEKDRNMATKPRSGTDRAHFSGASPLAKLPTWAFAAKERPPETKERRRRARTRFRGHFSAENAHGDVGGPASRDRAFAFPETQTAPHAAGPPKNRRAAPCDAPTPTPHGRAPPTGGRGGGLAPHARRRPR